MDIKKIKKEYKSKIREIRKESRQARADAHKEYLSRLLGRISYALMCEPADEELCEYKRIVIGLIKDY